MKYIYKRLYFKFLKINVILFIASAQNEIASGNMHTLIALFNTYLTFLVRTTDVVNGIHCIKGAKVKKVLRV